MKRPANECLKIDATPITHVGGGVRVAALVLRARDEAPPGECGPKNPPAANICLRLAADGGRPAAAFALAVNLIKGDGIAKSVTEGVRYVKMSADAGYSAAQHHFAVQLGTGEGVAVNVALANQYLRMSADQGHGEAQYVLGANLDVGHGIAADQQEALRYFRMSADRASRARSSRSPCTTARARASRRIGSRRTAFSSCRPTGISARRSSTSQSTS
jgi:hypothetical protein